MNDPDHTHTDRQKPQNRVKTRLTLTSLNCMLPSETYRPATTTMAFVVTEFHSGRMKNNICTCTQIWTILSVLTKT